MKNQGVSNLASVVAIRRVNAVELVESRKPGQANKMYKVQISSKDPWKPMRGEEIKRITTKEVKPIKTKKFFALKDNRVIIELTDDY